MGVFDKWKNLFKSSASSGTGLGNPYSMEYAELQDSLNTSGSANAGKVDLGLGNGVGSSGTSATTLGLENSTWSGLGSLATLGVGGLNAWTGMKQLDLAEDTFDFNKLDANRTYEMAKDAYDKNVARAGSIGTQMNKGKVG